MRSEAGFTLIEALIAGALAVIVLAVALTASRAMSAALRAAVDPARSSDQLDAAAAQMRAEANDAFAVWVPSDVACGGMPSSSVAFFSRDARGSAVTWAYARSAAGVTRTSSAGPSSERSAMLPGVSTLSASCVRAANTGLWVTGGDVPPDVAVPLGAPEAPQASGGNRVVIVTLRSAAGDRTIHLLPGVMPASFTVVGAPSFHAIVYRVDQTHRSFFGLVQKSHVWIKGRVEVSYDGFARDRRVWCDDLDVYGGPGGLDPYDPRTRYDAGDPNEQAAQIVARCSSTKAPLPEPGAAPHVPPSAPPTLFAVER